MERYITDTIYTHTVTEKAAEIELREKQLYTMLSALISGEEYLQIEEELNRFYICAKIGVSNIHPHCLRHTFATRGAENNVDVRVMQKFLGHATIKETADTYTHVLNDLKQSEILKLDKAVNY